MKKWAIPLAAAALIAVITVAGATFALSDSGDDDGSTVLRDAGGGGEPTGDDAAAICLEGAIDCDDTIEKAADPGVCIQIFPTPPECVDPDEPVSNDPGVPADSDPNSACTMEYPNKCLSTRLAVADLAGRLGIAEITVRGGELVEWPDACLGISQPDVACAEVITPGFRILLEANHQTYEYHTNGEGSRAVLVE